MTGSDKVVMSGGVSFCGLLTIVFVVLKLLGIIGWSWWLVLLPEIISFGIAVLIIIVILIVAIVKYARKRRKLKIVDETSLNKEDYKQFVKDLVNA